jgi:hypothetical protein
MADEMALRELEDQVLKDTPGGPNAYCSWGQPTPREQRAELQADIDAGVEGAEQELAEYLARLDRTGRAIAKQYGFPYEGVESWFREPGVGTDTTL